MPKGSRDKVHVERAMLDVSFLTAVSILFNQPQFENCLCISTFLLIFISLKRITLVFKKGIGTSIKRISRRSRERLLPNTPWIPSNCETRYRKYVICTIGRLRSISCKFLPTSILYLSFLRLNFILFNARITWVRISVLFRSFSFDRERIRSANWISLILSHRIFLSLLYCSFGNRRDWYSSRIVALASRMSFALL